MAGIVIAFFLVKYRLMQGASTDTFLVALVQHDAILFALLMLLYAVGAMLQRSGHALVSLVVRILAVTVFVVYIADVFAYFFFGTRLYVSDIVTFSGETGAVETLVRTGLARRGWETLLAAVGVSIILYACLAYILRRRTAGQRAWPFMALCLLLAAVYFVRFPTYVYAFGDKPLFENVVERNASYFRQTAYSEPFRRQLLATAPTPNCRKGMNKPLNVLLVIVESLSAYHSKYFSGIEDWTPRMDVIAAKETAITNFHANGWTTIGGLISLLTGTFPFVPERAAFNEWGSPRLDDFTHLEGALPRQLAGKGYQTTFVSAGDLGFLGQGNWLQEIGFQRIIGNRDPRFDSQTVRGPFDSVPDKLLYDVVLEEMDAMPAGKPYLITGQTFWSHRPFMAPDGSADHTEEYVIRMTDQMIGELYDRLESRGFFETGILIVTGDHRAMEPYRRTEIERFGSTAAARVPAIVATRAVDLPEVISDNYQQRDLQASLLALVADQYCLTPFEGAMFGPEPSAPGCVMHARADDRDLITVRCGEEEGVVIVAGDATAVASGTLSDGTSVVEAINRNRLRTAALQADLQLGGAVRR